MASGGLGSLVVEISANIAKLSTDMSNASAIVERHAKRMSDALDTVKHVFETLAVAETLNKSFEILSENINKSIEASAGLVSLSERTGATVENLSALSAVAKLSNTNTDEFAHGLQRLAKSMVDAEDGGTKTTAAFNAIGLSVTDLKGKNPDQVFLKIAQQLSTFADGTGKTVIAQELLGKSGANLLPLLKDLGDAGEYNATTTAKQAEAAEAYEKDLKRLQLAGDALWRTISAQIVPVLDAFAKALTESRTSGDGLKGTVDGLAADDSIRSWAESAAKVVAFVVDAFDGVGRAVQISGKAFAAVAAQVSLAVRGEFAAAAAVGAEFNKDVDAILSKAQFSARLAKQLDESHRETEKPGAARPAVDTSALKVNDSAAREARARFDAELKALQNFVAAENQAFTQRDADLKRLYDDDQISIAYYFGARQQAIDEHSGAIVAAYEQEIRQANAYLATLNKQTDAVARVETQAKIFDLQSKQQLAIADASEKSAANARDAAKATDVYADSIVQLQIQLAKMRGDLVAADQLEEQLYKKQLARQVRPGDTQGAAVADALAKQKIYDDQIAESNKVISALEAREATIEGRIALEQQTGAVGQLQSLAALGKARTAEIALLEKQYEEQVKIAATASDPKQAEQAQDNLSALRLKIDQLKAAADPLAEKFNNLFETTFADNLDKVVHGTETVSDAFRNMAISIVDELLKIEEQNIAMSIFGGGTTGGTGSLASLAASYFTGHASGGAVNSNTSYLVGERGPEVFRPHTDGTIISNQALSPNISVHPQIINVHDPSEIPTAMQGAKGEAAILNVISRNPSAIKNLLR